MDELIVRDGTPGDADWIRRLLIEHWGAVEVVSRGAIHRGTELPALIAGRGGERLGLLTYREHGDQCEVVTFDAIAPHGGVGTALLGELVRRMRGRVRRVWLITTNDNLAALRFYQRRGFALAALHPRAIEVSRRLKPSIPPVGHDGIPIRDELELEIIL
jgi:ribosomal protein S18 acetylase RimI-like enzyme